jgi:exosortase/archaeosortase family protein
MQEVNVNSEKQKVQKNKNILRFFLKLLALVSAWFVFYALILKPGRIIDRPVTNFVTTAAVFVINTVSPHTPPLSWQEEPVHKDKNYLIKERRQVLGIHDACNGIDLMFIYIGIIILLPYSAKRKFIFSMGGIVAIILANIIRVCLLYYIYKYHSAAFEFSHHYVFTILMYVLIFYGWLLFIKKDKPNEQSS